MKLKPNVLREKDLWLIILGMTIASLFMKLEVEVILVPVLFVAFIYTLIKSKDKDVDWISVASIIGGGLVIQLIDLIPVYWR